MGEGALQLTRPQVHTNDISEFVLNFYKKLEDITTREIINTVINSYQKYVTNLENEIVKTSDVYDYGVVENIEKLAYIILVLMFRDYDFLNIHKIDKTLVKHLQLVTKILIEVIEKSPLKPDEAEILYFDKNVYPTYSRKTSANKSVNRDKKLLKGGGGGTYLDRKYFRAFDEFVRVLR